MRTSTRWTRPLACLLLLFASGCGAETTTPARVQRDIPHIYTTFYPTTWFATRIAGDKGVVRCPLPADEDPIFWKPSDEALRAYQDDADLIIVNGAGLEKWVDHTSLPTARLVDTAAGFRDAWIQFDASAKHTHGGDVHVHEGTDGHTWVDPVLALRQAKAIADRLSQRYPQHKATYAEGARQLTEDLQSLDAAFRALGAQADGQWIYASHPAYGYPAKRYGWRVVNLDLDPEQMPTAEEIEFVRSSLGKRPGAFLWWESAPTPEIAAALKKQTGLESLVFSPCETPPGDGTYLDVMRANIERIRRAFDA